MAKYFLINLFKDNNHIKAFIDGDKMQNRTSEHKAMPDVMCMFFIFKHIENNSESIADSSGDNPKKYRGRHCKN